MAGGERRLAAIMFTDIVGYTRLSQADESLALELLEEHRAFLRPSFVAHGGSEVKTIGDAFLVEFKSALDAVLCAVEIQKKMRERAEGAAPSRKLELRIGVHVGDVVHGRDDIFGDAVNVASRIVRLAEPGVTCISQQVFDQVRNKTALDFERIGDVELKNVNLPVGVYRINLEARGQQKGERPGPRRRLAVLPFANISPDPNDEYFADGLMEELISKLSDVRDLKVISRTSAMSYKRKEKKVSEIARELDVGSVIEGSVRKAGSRIRISVQLVDARTEEHLWSANYDSELNDIFAIQSDVASKVASSLSSGFFSETKREDTSDVEAYTLYLRAIQLLNEANEASLREAVVLLNRAISKDPAFARAHAGLADAWGALGSMGYEDFATATSRAEASALKALDLGPGLAESHSSMASANFLLDRFDSALTEAEEAIRINPNLSDVYISLGILYTILRTPEEALSQFKRAYELDPLSVVTADLLAAAAYLAGEGDLALDVLARTKEFNPNHWRVYVSMAEYYMDSRDFGEAQRMLDTARKMSPAEPSIRTVQGVLFARAGRRKEAVDTLNEILADSKESVRLFGRLMIGTALDDLDEAFTALMRMAEIHSWPFLIRADPFFAKLRTDPRYLEFSTKVGLQA